MVSQNGVFTYYSGCFEQNKETSTCYYASWIPKNHGSKNIDLAQEP